MNNVKVNKFKFLGLNFRNLNFDDAKRELEYFISTRKPHMVFMPTAELIVRASEDNNLKNVYNNTHLLLIDSFVVYYMARLLRKPVSEPVNGARLMFSFLKTIEEKKYKVYLLGAREDILQKAIANLKLQYPNINIVGFHHGYFDFNNDEEVVRDIKEKNPDILFVAMSSPLKENFVSANLNKMNVPVCMGVGGSIDVIAGKCQLAPLWISKLGFEWFYRLIQEPRRMWKRYSLTNIKFLRILTKEIIGGRHNGKT